MVIKLVLGAVAIGAAVYAVRKVTSAAGEALTSAGTAISNAGTAVVDTTVTGVISAGTFVGIPETSVSQCERDMAAGDTWAASFSCPAGTWLKYLTTPKTELNLGHSAYWKS